MVRGKAKAIVMGQVKGTTHFFRQTTQPKAKYFKGYVAPQLIKKKFVNENKSKRKTKIGSKSWAKSQGFKVRRGKKYEYALRRAREN